MFFFRIIIISSIVVAVISYNFIIHFEISTDYFVLALFNSCRFFTYLSTTCTDLAQANFLSARAILFLIFLILYV